MSSPNGSFLAGMLLVAAALLLPAGYIGAYYAMLDRSAVLIGDGIPGTGRCDLQPAYRIHGDGIRIFFWPAHQADRRLSPQRWSIEVDAD